MREYEYDVDIVGEWRRPRTTDYDYNLYHHYVGAAARRAHVKVTFDLSPESKQALASTWSPYARGENLKGTFTLRGTVRAPNRDEAIKVALKELKRGMKRYMCRTPVLRAV